ncbi:MAG: hypothetical protein JW772_04405 [Candidatus Diapherotrites archaeon]|nr:hypothetical protein [Candidatus Diapherotrites archaeon]
MVLVKKRFLLAIFLLFLLSNAYAQENTVCAYFFYGPGCPHCAKASAHLETLEAKYPNFELHSMNINLEQELILELYQKYDVDEEVWGHVPVLFIGDQWILGDTPIIEETEPQIERYLETGAECPDKIDLGSASGGEISLPQLLGLAAVDAINPCELAVLVILMTAILTRFPKKRGKALQAGLSFSAAIFLMYLFFGVLIIFGFKFLTGVSQIGGTWFYNILALIAIILGIVNIKDAIWYGGGGFIMEVPQSWRPKMKGLLASVGMADQKEEDCPGCGIMQKGRTAKILRERSVLLGSFLVGLIVSFFLTPCTAGPYFVAGGILSNFPFIIALPYLLLYLAIFIAPMVIITLITYGGFLAVEDIGGWREKNIKKLHWVAGLLLLALGMAMLLGLF